MVIKNISFDILFRILSYLTDDDLMHVTNVSKSFYIISNYILRSKNSKLMKHSLFKKDKKILTWLNDKNYKINYTLRSCIDGNRLTKEYLDLKIFYIGEYYVENINDNLDNIKKTLESIL